MTETTTSAATQPAWVTPDIDPDAPSIARLYDYLLGGKHNLAADRALGKEAIKAAPGIIMLIRESRKFLQRAVRFAVDSGVDQFLDLGSGIPTRGSVHETAQAINPDARIVYVDRDPTAVAHGKHLLADNPGATSVRGDLFDATSTFAAPDLTELIDFDRPVAVLMLSVLHFFPDEQVLPALAQYREKLAPGSLLIIATATDEGQDGSASRVQHVYAEEFDTFELRSAAQMAALFGDFEVTEPGLVFPTQWRPVKPGDVGADPTKYSYLVGVGRKA